jgi:hypothetical protein
VVDTTTIKFNNTGKQVSFHNNAIGLKGRLAQPARRLHPHTDRNPQKGAWREAA